MSRQHQNTTCYVFIFLFSVLSVFQALAADNSLFHFSTPRTTAMGGGNIALPQGLEAFHQNPAALAFTDKQFTLPSTTVSIYSEPKYAFELIQSLMDNLNPVSGILLASKQMITGSGAGASADFGVGWTGNGWGAAIFGDVNAFFQGEPFPLGVNGMFNATMMLAGGYAIPFYLSDSIKMSVGAALRPMNAYQVVINGQTVDMIIGNPEQADALIKEAFTIPFFTIATDIGLQVFFGDHFVVGFSICNIGPAFSSPDTNRPQIPNPSSINAGLAYINTFSLFFLNMRVILTADMTGINSLAEGTISVWETLHFGGEFAMQDILFLRAGFNQGYLTSGFALKLWFLNVSASFYTKELGYYLGDMPLSALKLEFSIKF